MSRYLILIFMFAIESPVFSQYRVFEEYVKQYNGIAVSEMHRSGVPASIKLAQGLLESNAGRSELATRANNHFGIKCSNTWNGKTFYKEDDDYQEGKLIKSCFRAFQDVEESYIAHSEFLRDPSKVNRYGFLFRLKTTDYKAWANGLKQAGYATDPNYAHRLIKLIEEYQLYQYDKLVTPMDLPVVADLGSKGKSSKQVTLPTKITINNGVRMVYALHGETLLQISTRHKVSTERIIKYNEALTSAQQIPEYGAQIYLSKKRSRYRGKQTWHYVQEGEDLYRIAQLYGIRLSNLQSKNRLKEGEIPAVGTRVKLKGSRIRKSEKPVLKSKHENILPNQPTETSPDTDRQQPVISDSSRILTNFYKVEPGDTLYKISSKYNISIDDLRTINELEGDLIKIGQVLRLQ